MPFFITRVHRSGLRWDLGGRGDLDAAQSECRSYSKEPQDWKPIEGEDGYRFDPDGHGRRWTTETPDALEWFQIDEADDYE
jgi:hypothetical protein